MEVEAPGSIGGGGICKGFVQAFHQEWQTKTTQWQCHTPTRMTKLEKHRQVDQNMEKLKPSHFIAGNVKWYSHFWKVWQCLKVRHKPTSQYFQTLGVLLLLLHLFVFPLYSQPPWKSLLCDQAGLNLPEACLPVSAS